jgi:hypothetical protein
MSKLTGGGYNSRVVSQVKAGKAEPISRSVSVGAVSRLGSMVGEGTPKKELYSASTPAGTTSNLDCRPGGNNRMILPSGSQSKTPRVTDQPRGKNHW